MDGHFINYNPKRHQPLIFYKHDSLELCKKEAARLMKQENSEIHIYKYVGTVKPMPDYVFDEPEKEIPF